jgi:uncharacterized protein (DUF952 family)
MNNIVYHLAPIEYFHAQPPDRPYTPAEFEREGFIHCTTGDEQLVIVANRYYHTDERAFLVIVIDEDLVTAQIKYEPGNDEVLYPHIYGALNRSAIVSVLRMPRLPDGSFQFPDRNVTLT